MNTLDKYTQIEILLCEPEIVKYIGLLNKYYFELIKTNNVLRGCYISPPSRTMPLSKLKRYCDRPKLIEDFVKSTYKYSQQELFHPLDIPVRESEIYAIMTNNIDYLSYLVNLGYIFNDTHVYIALANNKSHIVKQFYKTNDVSMLAKMVYASVKCPDSLRYVLSLSNVAEIYNMPTINNAHNLRAHYYHILTFGHIECVKQIVNVVPKIFWNNIYFGVWYTDALLENIKYLHEQGYVLTADEFKMASSNNEHENIETLKYLLSIGIEFTDEQLSEWKKHPMCAEFLSDK